MRSIRYSTIFGSNPILAAMIFLSYSIACCRWGARHVAPSLTLRSFGQHFFLTVRDVLGRPLGAHGCLYLPVMFSTLDLISRHTRVLLFGSTSRFLPSLRTWSTPSRSAYIFPYLRERCYDAPCCGLSLRFTDLKRQMSFIGTRMW